MTPQEQIKEKLPLEDLVSGYTQLKPAGGPNLKGPCPIHQEKTPSLFVHKDKQLWHCFGCGQGGDHFAFIQKVEGIDFADALRMLADKTGVVLERFTQKESSEKSRLMEILQLTQSYFAKVLQEANVAQHARDYVASRHIPEELQMTFGIGYAPDSWDALTTALTKKGYRNEEMAKAGIAVAKQEGGVYARFRDRLMFPIWDPFGKVVGFTGRLLNKDAKEAKYVNTPQTALFDKGGLLYGLHLAKPAIREVDMAIIVEGQMDVVGSWRGGVKNVVASSGTALTERHVKLLKKCTSTVALCFDADAAGLAAAQRGIDLLLAENIDVKIITLPPGIKDPDELTVKNPDAWKKCIQEARHFIAVSIERASKENLQDPSSKKKAVEAVLQDIRKLQNAVEKDEWLKRAATVLQVEIGALRQALGTKTAAQKLAAEAAKPVETAVKRPNPLHELSELLLAASVHHLPFFAQVSEFLRPEDTNGLWTTLYAKLKESAIFSNIHAPASAHLPPGLSDDPAMAQLLSRAAVLGAERFGDPQFPQCAAEFTTVLRRYVDYSQKMRRDELTKKLKAAEALGDAAAVHHLLQEFQAIQQERRP